MARKPPKKRKPGKRSKSRRLSLRIGGILAVLLCLGASAAVWYVHHPRRWLDECAGSVPAPIHQALLDVGGRIGDLTDALSLTGHDAVYEYDVPAPAGSVLFAGAPRRIAAPAPSDVTILDRGHFRVGWSDSLRHPAWVAYHVASDAKFDVGKRPNFTRDRAIAAAPVPSAYERSGYDRGHMAPNFAIATRYGRDEQKKTFLMTNVAPQTPELNRGVWRDVEHRIAELWTASYGEIWVIVGSVSSGENRETISGTGVDVPNKYYQLVVAQDGLDVRALAVVFEQQVPWGAWAARYLVSIDELEELTGFDFLPELPEFIQSPLEAELPTRLWPVRFRDLISLFLLRYR